MRRACPTFYLEPWTDIIAFLVMEKSFEDLGLSKDLGILAKGSLRYQWTFLGTQL